MLDCGGRDDPIKEDLLKNVDFISPNETELKRVMNITDKNIKIDETLIRQQLLSKYPKMVVVLKKGSDGSCVLTNNLKLDV